jgi:hypothetical protein
MVPYYGNWCSGAITAMELLEKDTLTHIRIDALQCAEDVGVTLDSWLESQWSMTAGRLAWRCPVWETIGCFSGWSRSQFLSWFPYECSYVYFI